MKRREFITLLGGAAAVWPLAARAQQPGKIPRIGIIDDSLHWNAFRHGLRDLGYLEGQNIAFDYAYGDGVPERLKRLLCSAALNQCQPPHKLARAKRAVEDMLEHGRGAIEQRLRPAARGLISWTTLIADGCCLRTEEVSDHHGRACRQRPS